MSMSKEEIVNQLTPYLIDLILSYNEGIAQYKIDFLDSGVALRSKKRSVANYIHDSVWDKLIPRFENRQRENIFIREKNGVTFLQIGMYIIRLKKIDKNGRASNVVTKNSECYYTPLFDFSLFNNEQLESVKGINLTLGYIPNEARTEFSDLFLVAPESRKEIAWKQNLNHLNLDIRVDEITLPEVKREKREKKIHVRRESLPKKESNN